MNVYNKKGDQFPYSLNKLIKHEALYVCFLYHLKARCPLIYFITYQNPVILKKTWNISECITRSF